MEIPLKISGTFLLSSPVFYPELPNLPDAVQTRYTPVIADRQLPSINKRHQDLDHYPNIFSQIIKSEYHEKKTIYTWQP